MPGDETHTGPQSGNGTWNTTRTVYLVFCTRGLLYTDGVLTLYGPELYTARGHLMCSIVGACQELYTYATRHSKVCTPDEKAITL